LLRARPCSPCDEDSAVPEDLRPAFKLLKNSNCLPVEMELWKEIFMMGSFCEMKSNVTTAS
jgi:hypothetical protein